MRASHDALARFQPRACVLECLCERHVRYGTFGAPDFGKQIGAACRTARVKVCDGNLEH